MVGGLKHKQAAQLTPAVGNLRDLLLCEEVRQVGLGTLSLSNRQWGAGWPPLPGTLFSAALPAADQTGTEPFTLSRYLWMPTVCQAVQGACGRGVDMKGTVLRAD